MTITNIVPARQGAGRFDDPDSYRVLYAASSPEAAVGELLGDLAAWERSVRALSLVEISLPAAGILDLDDPRELVRRSLRPSTIVWPERTMTQAIARSIQAEGTWTGLSWWSKRFAPWNLLALWSFGRARIVGEPVPLSIEHPAVVAAAEALSVAL